MKSKSDKDFEMVTYSWLLETKEYYEEVTAYQEIHQGISPRFKDIKYT